ncbi:MAG: UDP-N-acetyl-D-galactosamine dehydrogenase [Chitinophagaceae bacterium]|nr:UDP-N-acetyl-D-galactosamine dehydrogenase [Chitinophagaceae bacterium]
MDFSIFSKLKNKEASLAVIGLGYVGLPIALAFAKKIKVVGFDINAKRVEQMKNNIDPSGELAASDFANSDIEFTDSLDVLKKASFFIVTVPTPIDAFNFPDLKPLISASTAVGKILKKGDYIVYESTVYPGCTEEDCIPVLEKESGLKFNVDFKVGYSPERINPGDKEHTLAKIMKVVSGCDEQSLDEIAKTYEIVVEAGIHKASSIQVAEAAKIIENTQRDLNIALMNELSVIFDKMNINTYEVLEAAGTKWNFLRFSPGLVGGHCIGVDPYYLTYKAKKLGYNPYVILSGRYINDAMSSHVAKKTLQQLIQQCKDLSKARVLVMGVTFKENVEDIRNSKVADLIRELKSYGLHVDSIDPLADAKEFEHEYNLTLQEKATGTYDAVVLAVSHKEYIGEGAALVAKLLTPKGILIDIKGVFRKNTSIFPHYWSL